MRNDAWRGNWYTEEIQALEDSVRRIYSERFAPHEPRWETQGHVDRDIWRLASDAGLLCAGIPAEYGGLGGTFAHEAIVYYEQFRAGITSFGNTAHSGIVSHYIAAYGNERQKRQWLPRLASGEYVTAIAMSEPDAGSDLQGLRTNAQRDGDEYILRGSKTFISNGQQADLFCVAVRHGKQERSRALSLVMVESARTPGLKRGRNLEKIGLRGQDTSEIFLDDARVPCENLLGETEGLGFAQMMEQLPRERLIVGLMGLGTIDRALEHTIAHARQRRMFGKTMVDLQNVRFALADACTQATIARSFLGDCIDRLLAGQLDAATASMAKCWITDAQCQIVDQCLQLHGGYGYMAEAPISRMYLDSRIQKIYGGANEIMREIIARSLLRS